MDAEEHKAAHWLVVRHVNVARGPLGPGWYVVRICPCHHGQQVTLPYSDRERAERVRRILLGEVTTPTEPKLSWDLSAPCSAERPPEPEVGQVWFDRHNRSGRVYRFVRIEHILGAFAEVRTVMLRDGRWLAPLSTSSRVRLDRFSSIKEFAFVGSPSAGYDADLICPKPYSGEEAPPSGATA